MCEYLFLYPGQGLEAHKYKNTWDVIVKISKHEGLKAYVMSWSNTECSIHNDVMYIQCNVLSDHILCDCVLSQGVFRKGGYSFNPSYYPACARNRGKVIGHCGV